MAAAVLDVVEQALGRRPQNARPLGGGSVATVWELAMPGGEILVGKTGAAGARLDLEGWMLGRLRARSALPVPEPLFADDRLLVMTHIDGGDPIGADAERDAARHLAALHDVTAPRFGLERDTLIGGLPQPNGEMPYWRDFFRDRRLLYMAREALDAGRLPTRLMGRIERLAGRLDSWIDADAPPSLIHGDMWGGNVLARGGRIAGFVDPAIYYADAEIELAFATMFGTYGDAFFGRYRELRPIRPGFFAARRDLYNLYPTLVHVRLFGGAYVGAVGRLLSALGG